MKKSILLILSLFLFFNINAQELSSDSTTIDPKLLLGNWGFDYADYQDGTLVRDDYMVRSTATMLSFRKAKAVTAMYHANANTMLYSVLNNKLTVGTSSYKIEKLTNGELVFSVWEDVVNESYKVLRYHYLATKESSEIYFYRKFVKPNIRIKPNGDTAYAFTEDFYPHYVVKADGFSKYELDNFNDVFQTSYQAIEKAFNFPVKTKGHFGVQFDITKTGQIADVEIKESSDSAYNNQLIRAVSSTSKSWKNAEYANKPIAVQFNYIFDYKEKEEQENAYFDQEYYQTLMERANNFFVKQNYEKAVKLYTKCILMTDDAIDALYKRADCYFTVNAIKNACSDWNYLAGKGHKRAEGLYLKHCMK
jgi:hypothetical protein